LRDKPHGLAVTLVHTELFYKHDGEMTRLSLNQSGSAASAALNRQKGRAEAVLPNMLNSDASRGTTTQRLNI